MGRRTFWGCVLAAALAVGTVSLPAGATVRDAKSLIGEGILNFSLPSDQGRLVNYLQDYYGRSNLIITFFPAAFTPI